MTPLATGSGLERLLACDGPAYLRHIESTSDDADRGRAIHAFLESASASGRDVALGLSPESLRPALEALDLTKLPVDPARFAAEVAFALDVKTGEARELGRGIGRRYEVTGTEVAGTADVIALLEDDGVFVADFKSGWSKRAPARENAQLRFYALAAARAYGRSRAVVQIIRIMEDGATWTDEAELDAFDLDAFDFEIRTLGQRILRLRDGAEEARIAEGAHCKWCPSFSVCPAKQALLRSAALAAPAPEELTPEVASKAYERIRLFRAALDKAEEILRDYARAHPIPLADGFVYGVRQDSTKTLDGHVAMLALREAIGPWADTAIDVKVSQAGVERAAKLWVEQNGGSVAAKKRELLDLIASRGGVKVVTAPKLVAHRPKEAA